MNLATWLLPQRIVEALGWTLFHSLWQGALAALGFAAVLFFSRRSGARLRYGLGLAALALVVLMSGLTFWSHYASGAAAGPAVQAGPAASAPAQPAAAPALGAGPRPRPVAAFFGEYFSRHLPLIVTLWLLGVLFLTLRFSGEMLYAQRLKYRQVRPLPPPWPDRLRDLAARAGLKRPLRLLESLRLRTPVVIGHLKPVLLLPAGLVTGLSGVEVEALLAHELAHVMRGDYLVNVAQNLAGILYFFHPGVRWISACVSREREHCCDDFAVELCGDARGYARALARLQVGDLGFPEPALAAAGRGQLLLRRIARLLGGPRLAHDFREGFMSALLLVVGLLVMLKLAAAAGAVPAPAPGAEEPRRAPAAQTESRFARASFALEANGVVRLSAENRAETGGSPGTWIVNEDDGQVIWFMDLSAAARAGGSGAFSEEVPLDRGAYSWYRPAGWQARVQWQPAAGKGPWQPLALFVSGARGGIHDGVRGGVAGEQARLRRELERARQEELGFRAGQERKLKEEQLLEQEKLRRLEAELRAASGAERAAREQELQKLEQELRAKAEAMQAMKEQERLAYESERLMKEKQLQATLVTQGLHDQVRQLRAAEKQLQAEEQRLKNEEKKFRMFIQELVGFGLVKKGESCEITLSAGALEINGKKLPAAVQEKVRKSYESLFGRKLGDKEPIRIVQDGV